MVDQGLAGDAHSEQILSNKEIELVYELLLSADFMVPDPDAMAESLHQRLGIHRHPNWRQAFPNHTYVAWFLRIHKALAVAPTRLEPQGHLDKPNLGDPLFREHLESLSEFQGHARPLKTHSTVLVVKDVMEVADRLARKRLPFRVARITPEMPFDRLWVGLTPERPRYEPSVDGGLCLEFIPLAPLQIPKEVYDTPPPQAHDAKPGDLVRVTNRGYLVRDLDDTLRRLSANLGLEPEGRVETLADQGMRRARIRFRIGHSATLDLIEPTASDGAAGRYLNVWGPGPYYTRIAALGLEAAASELDRRETPFEVLEVGDVPGGRVLRVDPDCVHGAIIELIEHGSA